MTEWISIHKEKPERLQIVLVWLPRQKQCVCLRYDPIHKKRKWKVHIWDEHGDWDLGIRDAGQFMPYYEEVEYWMPLPEPPPDAL